MPLTYTRGFFSTKGNSDFMARYTPQNIGSGLGSTTKINENFDNIETAINDSLSRKPGDTPNAMETDIDMNSNKLLNVASGTAGTDGVNLSQVNSLIAAIEVPSGGGGSGGGTGPSETGITTLQMLTTDLSAYDQVVTTGYTTANDRGKGRWVATGTTSLSDAGTIIPRFGNVYDSLGKEFEWADEWVNVMAFGALGDGATDDTTPVQGAHDYSDNVYYPSDRTYYLTDQVSVTRTGSTLYAKGATLKWEGTLLQPRGLNIVTDEVTVIGGKYEGSENENTYLSHNGIWVQGDNATSLTTKTRIYDAECSGWAGAGILTQYCHDVIIKDCYLHSSVYAGVWCSEGSQDIKIANNLIVDIFNHDTIFPGNPAWGILVSKTPGAEASNPAPVTVLIEGNTIRNVNSYNGIEVFGATDAIINNNMVYNCIDGIVASPYDSATTEEARNPTNVIISNNVIKRTDDQVFDDEVQRAVYIGHDPDIDPGTGCSVINNKAYGYGDDASTASGGKAAFHFEHQSGLIVKNNLAYDHQVMGYAFKGCTDLRCKDNYAQSDYGTAPTTGTASFNFASNPSDGDILTINTCSFTFRASADATLREITIGGDTATSMTNAANKLNGWADGRISTCTYSATATQVVITPDTPGRAFNSTSFPLAAVGPTVSSMSIGTYDVACGYYFDDISGASGCSGIVSDNIADTGTQVGFVAELATQQSLDFGNNKYLGTATKYDCHGTTYNQEAVGKIKGDYEYYVISTIGDGSDQIAVNETVFIYVPTPTAPSQDAVLNVSVQSDTFSSNTTLQHLTVKALPGNNYTTIVVGNYSGSFLTISDDVEFHLTVDKLGTNNAQRVVKA